MGQRAWPWIVVALCGTLAGWAAAVRADRSADDRTAGVQAAIPEPIRADRYATSDTCRACHPGAYATWHDTYHRTMTQPASATAIVGAFDGRWVGDAGHRVGREGEIYWVESPDRGRQQVVMVTGSHHMQVYWVRPDPDDGRLIAFDYAWLIPEQTWTPNESTLLRPPSEVTYTWNRVCIKCHAVSGVPGFEPATQSVSSGVAELGIACEACHGPAQEHVALHRNPLARYLGRMDADRDVGVVNPKEMTGRASSQICGQCHSITVFDDDERWVEQGHTAVPPDPIDAWGHVVRHPLRADQPFAEALLDDDPDYFANRFWYDGMVRVSGREYNGLIESPCAVSDDFGCLSCHSMHAADPDEQLAPADEDAACRQCHPTVASAGSAHTHHAEHSSGSRCVNCHMPRTTYGLLQAMRSHEISSPSVLDDTAVGRPNACNLCHADASLAWTADALHRWYGQPELTPETVDQLDPEASALQQWLLAGDAGQRALAAWHLGWDPARAQAGDWVSASLAELLVDPYPALRWVALRALRRQPGFETVEVDLSRVTRDDVEALQGAAAGQFEAWLERRDQRPISLAE